MWIFLRDSFLSVVQYDEEPRLLLVRARFRGDIERIFPEASVAEDLRGDYRFRTVIARERVAHVIALRLQQLDYVSLFEQVQETERGGSYDRVYDVMLQEQIKRYGAELDLPGFVPTYDLEADPTVVPAIPAAD